MRSFEEALALYKKKGFLDLDTLPDGERKFKIAYDMFAKGATTEQVANAIKRESRKGFTDKGGDWAGPFNDYGEFAGEVKDYIFKVDSYIVGGPSASD